MFIPCYSGFHFSSLCFTLSGFRTFFSDTHQHILLWPFKNWMKNIWARSAFAQEKECCRYVDNTSNNPVVCWIEVFRMWTRSRCILYKTIYRRQKLSEMILDINRSNYGFAFVYRPNWTILGPITIINRICDQNHSIADYVRNRRGKVTNNLNGSGQYNWSTWSNIDRLYETVYFRKLSLFRFNLSILLNSLYYILYHMIFGWMI